MGVWRKVGNLGEVQDNQGNSVVYGEFGFNTYGLHTTVDGIGVCIKVADLNDASAVLARLADGWRPVNWHALTERTDDVRTG